MPKIIDNENARDIQNGAVVSENGFTKAVRSFELNTLQNGDIITIPQPGFKVLSRKIRNSENSFEYVNVDVDRNGTQTVGQFIPSSLYKNVEEVDQNGVSQGRKMASGTAVKDLQDYVDINKFFADHAGKKIKITTGPQFRAAGINGGAPYLTRVNQYDWVN